MSDEEDEGDRDAGGGAPEEQAIDEKGFPVVTARKLQQQLNPMQLRMAELKKKQEVRGCEAMEMDVASCAVAGVRRQQSPTSASAAPDGAA